MKFIVTFDNPKDTDPTDAYHCDTLEEAVAEQLNLLRAWQQMHLTDDPLAPYAIYKRQDASAQDAAPVSFTERDEAFHNNVKALVRAARRSQDYSDELSDALDKFRYVT